MSVLFCGLAFFWVLIEHQEGHPSPFWRLPRRLTSSEEGGGVALPRYIPPRLCVLRPYLQGNSTSGFCSSILYICRQANVNQPSPNLTEEGQFPANCVVVRILGYDLHAPNPKNGRWESRSSSLCWKKGGCLCLSLLVKVGFNLNDNKEPEKAALVQTCAELSSLLVVCVLFGVRLFCWRGFAHIYCVSYIICLRCNT